MVLLLIRLFSYYFTLSETLTVFGPAQRGTGPRGRSRVRLGSGFGPFLDQTVMEALIGLFRK